MVRNKNTVGFSFFIVFLLLSLAAAGCGQKQSDVSAAASTTAAQTLEAQSPEVQSTQAPAESSSLIPLSTEITKESQTVKDILEGYSKEECIAFLKERGVGLPEGTAEEQAAYTDFFYGEFQRVLENPDYYPVFGRWELMVYSAQIKQAVMTELGDEERLKDEHLQSIFAGEQRRIRQEELQGYTDEQCIVFLREKGVELPKDEQEYWTEFFCKVFRGALDCVLQGRLYQPAYPKEEHMRYAVNIARAVLSETGTEGQIAEFEAFATGKLAKESQKTGEEH